MRAAGAILLIAALAFAIGRTGNEAWLTVWLLLLVFLAVPLALIGARDLLWTVLGRRADRSRLLLHVCAAFAAVLGYAVGAMAVASGHPKVHWHQLMVVVFPLLVYATPLLVVLHGVPLARVRRFYAGAKDENA